MEQEIIQPIEKEVLKSELTPDRQLRMTNKSHNEIYIITAHNAPNVMKEIGRLREIAFREAGGGTGKDMDIDELISARTAINNSSSGIQRLRRLLVATVISKALPGRWMNRDSLNLLPATCSISLTSS